MVVSGRRGGENRADQTKRQDDVDELSFCIERRTRLGEFMNHFATLEMPGFGSGVLTTYRVCVGT